MLSYDGWVTLYLQGKLFSNSLGFTQNVFCDFVNIILSVKPSKNNFSARLSCKRALIKLRYVMVFFFF